MKRRNTNPYKVMFSLYRHFVPNKKKAILFMFFQLLSRLSNLLSPYLFAQILNIIQRGDIAMWNDLMVYFIVLMLLPLIEWAFNWPARIWEEELQFETVKKYQMYLYHCATSLSLERHTNNHSGETIDKINKAKTALWDFSWNIFNSLWTFISFFGSFIALILIWPGIGLILAILGIIILVLIFWFDKKIVTWIREENSLYHKVNSLLVDYLSNIKTLITLRFLSPTEKNLDSAIDKTYTPFRLHVVRTEWKWFTVDLMLQISLQVTMIIYVYHTRSTTGTIIIGTITMIYQYVERASNTFYNVAWQYSQMVQNVANTQSVDNINSSYTTSPNQSDTQVLWDWKDISINHLSFYYKWQERKNNILSDIELSFKRGERVALVGESGSGKSTFLSLLRGLYNPQTVQINIDGTIYDNLSCLFNDTSLIPQEPEIFEESITFNVSMWLHLPQETIEKYSKLARFHEVAIWLPRGYDTSIKEKWVNLSGGQKQRLALARWLLVAEESSIVLLDESTSSVDSVNEKKIYTNIFESFSDKTIIAAIHKLHLLSMFDVIYVFDQWRIIESGTFQSLLDQSWMLAKMREEYQASQKKRRY